MDKNYLGCKLDEGWKFLRKKSDRKHMLYRNAMP
jgi:hypothetical protein